MGILSAVTRLIKAVVFSIIMMPRIAYSFFGRLLEGKLLKSMQCTNKISYNLEFQAKIMDIRPTWAIFTWYV
jgi:hypothetical protein